MNDGKPNVENLKHHFIKEGRLSYEQAIFIIDGASKILKTEENLLHIESPLTGIIH